MPSPAHRVLLLMRQKTDRFWLAKLVLLLTIAAIPLSHRWHEEANDKRVAIAVDWDEVRDFNARRALTASTLLAELKSNGVSAVVLTPMTLSELISDRRVQMLDHSGADILQATGLHIADLKLAQLLKLQWEWREITGLQLHRQGTGALISRTGGFAALKDMDVGFDTALLKALEMAGLKPILRITNDPWLMPDHFNDWMATLPNAPGILFSADDIPGGSTQGPVWRSWMNSHGVVQFMPEFKPAPSAWQLAYQSPANTFRAHSIPSTELVTLKPAQQRARWQRAVEERSCRLLLVRIAPGDSRASFLLTLSGLHDLLQNHKWEIGFPEPRSWSDPNGLQRRVSPLAAFLIVCITPWFALRWAKEAMPRWPLVLMRVALVSLAGALLAAAVAGTPWTRVEIIPFRGVKWAFLFSWLSIGSLLYTRREFKALLSQPVKRQDLAFGGLAVVLIGYLFLRTGNAPSLFKPSWEQPLREFLDRALLVRPRFKEFAIGWPTLCIGLYAWSLSLQRQISWDTRIVVWIGMMGPISMLNTFCHLHSPLRQELIRSWNGFAFGLLFGSIAVGLLRHTMKAHVQRLVEHTLGGSLRTTPLPSLQED
jgi:hypothetical protein